MERLLDEELAIALERLVAHHAPHDHRRLEVRQLSARATEAVLATVALDRAHRDAEQLGDVGVGRPGKDERVHALKRELVARAPVDADDPRWAFALAGDAASRFELDEEVVAVLDAVDGGVV